ncbi:hypothetical protein GCM10010123_16690 [Pilimelia anulata]|uniref:Lipoprotein n=1 Tax=Pilimelia anulata TaxID=53371 RepID=A0A8J3B8M8_9ACTN|nr:hypothetical protein [Pilimelia anulata]GGJ87774.1 hypothetical protein GCM10010123_16690 [Pilimelia anulata]
MIPRIPPALPAALTLVLALALAAAGCGREAPLLAGHRFPTDYLTDRAAVIHLSTQSFESSQQGRAVFVGRDGGIDVYRTGGLDMGKLAGRGRLSVQVPEATAETVVGGAGGTYRRAPRAIGFFAAWLPSAGYVTLFNAGRTGVPGGYRFEATWRGGPDGTGPARAGSIDRYLIAAGECGDDVYALAEAHGPGGAPERPVSLLRLRFGERLDVTTVARWPRTPATFGTVAGRLGCAGGAVHFWYETIGAAPAAAVCSVDLRTAAVRHRLVRKYADTEEQEELTSWHVDRSTHVHAGRLYHVDGQGGILAVTLATGEVRRGVALPLPPYRMGLALTYWSDSRLHVLHQPVDLGQPATLTTYDADTGSPLRQLDVRGLGALVEEGVTPHDLLVLP